MAPGRHRPRAPLTEAPPKRRRSSIITLGVAAVGLTLLAAQLVLAAPPSASFNAPSNLLVGQQGTFTSTTPLTDADGHTISAIAWTFGDGGSASGSSVGHAYTARGTYTVTMTVTDSAGETGSATRTVVVNAPPLARFTSSWASPNRPDAGEEVSFTSTSTDAGGSIASHRWEFGDGATSTQANPKHTYTGNGPKQVRLVVTDNQGATGETTATLTVNAKPVARGIAAAVNPLPGQNAQAPLIGQQVALASTSTDAESTNAPALNNTITNYTWADSGGPIGGNSQGVVRAPYTTAGNKLVALRVVDSDGSIGDAVVTVRVNTPPVADFLVLPQTPLRTETVTFSQTARDADDPGLTAPNNGTITKYEWDLDGDGQYDDSTAPQPQKAFTEAGEHTVGLRVTDGGGATHAVARRIPVVNTRPAAAFGSGPAFPLPGQAVTFTSGSAPSAGATIVKQEWDFDYDPAKDSFAAGDVDAEGGSASHAFTSAGAKTVGLRVTEAGGGMDIATRSVIVNGPPAASFNAAPGTPEAGDEVTFTSTSADPDGPLTSQQWDTDGDGQFDDATGAVARQTFARPGSYTVRLRVTDDRGASAVHSGGVRVAARGSGGAGGGGSQSSQRVLSVFVQIAGRTSARGAMLSMLRVRAPKGATIRIRCRGEGCPVRALKRAGGTRRLRFKSLERDLPAGIRIAISITKRDFIGRYVQFTIRRTAAPRRLDRCLRRGATRPSACPS